MQPTLSPSSTDRLIPCPSCAMPMANHRFGRKQGGDVDLDICFGCQGIWFDAFESLQLTPGAVVELFRLVHEHQGDQRFALKDTMRCPRCASILSHAFDLAKVGGRFNYHRCARGHGRLTTFGQFMIEKGFVRQLSPAEILALQARVTTVRCSSCGAPIDIQRNHACTHCRAPLTFLDPAAVAQALGNFQQAEIKRTTVDQNGVADAILSSARSTREKASFHWNEAKTADEGSIGDLVVAGAALLLNLLQS
jgi:hypothetical protein